MTAAAAVIRRFGSGFKVIHPGLFAYLPNVSEFLSHYFAGAHELAQVFDVIHLLIFLFADFKCSVGCNPVGHANILATCL